jgi:hypothetical protein
MNDTCWTVVCFSGARIKLCTIIVPPPSRCSVMYRFCLNIFFVLFVYYLEVYKHFERVVLPQMNPSVYRSNISRHEKNKIVSILSFVKLAHTVHYDGITQQRLRFLRWSKRIEALYTHHFHRWIGRTAIHHSHDFITHTIRCIQGVGC